MAKILILDDEVAIRESLGILLKRKGHDVVLCENLANARHALAQVGYDLIYSDLRLPDGQGIDLLRDLEEQCNAPSFIMMTAFSTTETAVEAMKLGALDYIHKPFSLDEIELLTDRALEQRKLKDENASLKARLQDVRGRRLVGNSDAMNNIKSMIRRVADGRATVLITGESGTGKEMVARTLHDESVRGPHPFIPVNCGAIPENLIESEFFGHKKGSFTGANVDRAGLFEEASAGTIFLDEIGELPMSMQVKLLRVLQEREVRRIGEHKVRPLECRVLAATNRDLEVEVANGRFREDLYFRLNIIQINIPPLRERSADIPALVDVLLRKHASAIGRDDLRFDDSSIANLVRHDWPGNIRQLENVIERAVTLAESSLMTNEVLPTKLVEAHTSTLNTASAFSAEPVSTPLSTEAFDAQEMPLTGNFDDNISLPHVLSRVREHDIKLESLLEAIERRIVREAIENTKNKTEAANRLGLSFRSLRYRLTKLGLGPVKARSSSSGEPSK